MKKNKFNVITIGDPTIDTFLFVDDIEIKKVAGHRKAIISWGDKLPVQHFYRSVAGNAANAAVGFSRLGLRTAAYLMLAHDMGGREIVHKMQKEKVADDYIAIDDKFPTNASTVLSKNGERTIFVYHEKRNYKLPKFVAADWVYLTSMGHGFEKIYKDLAVYLDKTKAKLAFNPGTFQLRKGPKFNRVMLERTELLSVNKEEAQSWVGDSEDFELLCKKLMALGPKSVIITDGRRGAYSFSNEGYFYIPEYPGPRVEATGAGDSFTTAYVAALMHGKSHQEALRWGAVNASSVVMEIGPQAGLLTVAKINNKIKKRHSYKAVAMVDEKTKSKIAAYTAKIEP